MKTSNYSTVLTVTTDPLSLDTPIIDAMGTITYNSAVINWQEVDNVQGYKIYLENTDDSLVILDDLDVSNVLTYNLTGLYQNTNYQYKVKAYYNSLESSYSDTDDFITNDFVILPPTINANSDLTFDSVRINWTKRSNATSYKLYLENTDTTTVIINGVDVGDIDTYLFDGLDPSSNYLWKIKSYNSDINEESSYSSNQTFITNDPIPDTPTVSSSTSITYNSFVANWSSETYADSYNVYVYTDIALTTLFVSYTGVLTNSKSVTGLTATTDYYTVVEAVNESGVSTKSAYMLTSTEVETEERILFMRGTDASINYEGNLYSCKLDGSDIQQHTITPTFIRGATFIKNGDIVYSRNNGFGNYKLYKITKSSGYTTENELLNGGISLIDDNSDLKASLNENKIVYTKQIPNSYADLYEFDLDTNIERAIRTDSPAQPYMANYNNDDTEIYHSIWNPPYTSTSFTIEKVNTSTLTVNTVVSGVNNSFFSITDDNYIYYIADTNSTFSNEFNEIRKKSLSSGIDTQIVNIGVNTYYGIGIDSNSNKLYFCNKRSPHTSTFQLYKANVDGTSQELVFGSTVAFNDYFMDLKELNYN